MTTLRLVPEQAAFLREHLAAAREAQQALNLVFTTIVRGHGLDRVTLVKLDGDDLIVTGADE